MLIPATQAETTGRIAQLQSSVEQGVEQSGVFSYLLDPINRLKDHQNTLDQLQNDLQYEKDQDFPSARKIDEFTENIVVLEQEKKDLEIKLEELVVPVEEALVIDEPEGVDEDQVQKNKEEYQENMELYKKQKLEIESLWGEKNKTIEKLQTQIEDQEKLLNERRSKNEENIQIITRNINEVEESIIKQKQLMKNQLWQIGVSILVFIGIVFGLLVSRFVLIQLFERFSGAMHIHRKTVLIHLLKVSFNIIIVVLILGILFSQVFSIIPFIALVGTGVAFALRDSISSFFAWFFIGTKNGYKVGDVLQTDDSYGRVKEITPFFTVLRQRDHEAESGKIVTIPNKFFLEKKIVNLSRFQEFTQITLSFILTEKSDVEKARELLRGIVIKHNAKNIELLHKYDKRLTRDFKLNPEDLEPYLWYAPGEGGIVLKVKFFASFLELNRTKHIMVEEFTLECRRLKSVSIYYG